MEIKTELERAVEKYRRLARRNYYTAYFIYLLAIVASLSATILTISGIGSRPVLAAITAIPGTVLLLAATFRFSERARWHYDKKNQLNALYRLVAVQADGLSLSDAVERWNKIDGQMEKTWPSFSIPTTKIKSSS